MKFVLDCVEKVAKAASWVSSSRSTYGCSVLLNLGLDLGQLKDRMGKTVQLR